MTTRSTRARSRYRYLLGDSRREAARLRRQARLWDPTAHALFDRIKVRRGWKVLEIGPGQGSIYRELQRRVRGPVDAVERSAVFADRLERLMRRQGGRPGRIWRTDLIDAPLPKNHYDLIFARFVFLFLPETERHVRKLISALRPGGLLAVEDYHRENFTMIPEPPEWADFMEADLAFFAQEGGNGSVISPLREIYRRNRLDVVDLTPTIRTGHPGSPTWNWVTSYFMGVFDQMARLRPLTPSKVASLRRFWQTAQRDPASVIIAPAVVDLVGRKK